ncbi:hypothetical protein PQG02_14515 [Nostoc sp. UHCC 0926]|uniref:hypothetical protein n=1 Tax=unclassified Nostoc TaxID=2593658 RepID=UPI00236018A1|nr:hypothetical protein [Nostoc sp. UHCC 0926]WDD35452.1 hypothetical protein PQG02_14515 [Nostoc sp. UHCC 0926]
METKKLRTHIGVDGILHIQTPTDFKDTSVEVVVVVQPLDKTDLAPCDDTGLQYNAWRKPTTKKLIQEAIAKMQQLRREVALDKTSIREMLEDGRRF